MESKHTPGPWKVNEYGNVEQNNGAYHLVATCSGISSNLKERESNAQLIACAPEMLEALEHVIGEFEEFNGELLLKTYEKLQSLVFKAKGGKQ